MPKLPVLKAPELIKILNKMGFESIRQKGSHVFSDILTVDPP